VIGPIQLLTGWVEEIIFCDRKLCEGILGKHSPLPLAHEVPKATFIQGDIWNVLEQLGQIHVLFYRCDSGGEGGSGIFILGKRVLPRILEHMPTEGGLLITDGSNHGGGLWRKMLRPEGYTWRRYGWHLQPASQQPFLRVHGLYVITVSKVSAIPHVL
jgi:hypothetical protein